MSLNASRYARAHAHIKAVGYVPLDLGPIARPAPAQRPAPGIDAPTDLAGRKPVAWVGSFFYDEANVICRVPLGPKKVRVERWVMTRV